MNKFSINLQKIKNGWLASLSGGVSGRALDLDFNPPTFFATYEEAVLATLEEIKKYDREHPADIQP